MLRYFAILITLFIFQSCSNNKEQLRIFHAGSLSVPFNEIRDAYNYENPEIEILYEQSGSLAAARKITELNKNCDVLAVADYLIIDNIMIPDYASWNYVFAANEMVIAYNNKSAYSDIINSENWFEIIQKKDVISGRSEPNLDPCGYRTLFVFMLSEFFYDKPNLADKLENHINTVIRPKETDLLAVLETGNIDYLFIYKSIALQHNLEYIKLPDKINLSNPEYDNYYASVELIVDGAEKGEKVTIKGSSILYSLTIPLNHEKYNEAIKFVSFILDSEKGGKILKDNGMTPVKYVDSLYLDKLPKELYDLN